MKFEELKFKPLPHNNSIMYANVIMEKGFMAFVFKLPKNHINNESYIIHVGYGYIEDRINYFAKIFEAHTECISDIEATINNFTVTEFGGHRITDNTPFTGRVEDNPTEKNVDTV